MERTESALWELTPARCTDTDGLEQLARAARARGLLAPSDRWLADLADDVLHAGFGVGEGRGDRQLAVWAGETRAAGRVGALLELPLDAWLGLEEVLLPACLGRWARELAGAARG